MLTYRMAHNSLPSCREKNTGRLEVAGNVQYLMVKTSVESDPNGHATELKYAT
jgi:hypothetical protein